MLAFYLVVSMSKNNISLVEVKTMSLLEKSQSYNICQNVKYTHPSGNHKII